MVYDELETFRPSSDLLFDYPFSPRKTDLGVSLMKIADSVKSFINSDYTFESRKIKFRKSQVCLEPSVFSQFSFI
jgi:hypothetical protein